MINNLKDISIDSLRELMNFINSNINNASSLEDVIGDVKTDIVFGTLFYKPKNNIFSSISISSKKNKITQVDFIGDFNFTYKELLNKYDNYREHYSPRDNLYFYFFNENKIKGNFVLECRIEKKITSEIFSKKVNQLTFKL